MSRRTASPARLNAWSRETDISANHGLMDAVDYVLVQKIPAVNARVVLAPTRNALTFAAVFARVR